MTVDGQGVAHVVFGKVDPIDGLPKIYYWNSTMAATTLIPLDDYPVTIITSSVNAYNADIAVEPSGTAHVALLGWHDEPIFGSEVYYTNNNTTDNTFAQLQLVEEVSDVNSQSPSIDVDENGKVAIAFAREDAYSYTPVYTSNASGTFPVNPVAVATDTIWQNYPKVRAAKDFAYYFYPQVDFDNRPSGRGIADMFYVKLNEVDGSPAFAEPIRFRQFALNTSGYMTYQNGRVYFTWIEYRQEKKGKKTVNIPELYYTVLDANTGAEVSPPEEITDGGQGHTNLTVDSDGHAHIVYRSSGDIFYATNAPPPPLPPGSDMVSGIDLSSKVTGPWTKAVATITVMSNGSPVSGAVVDVIWTGTVGGTDQETTDSNGEVVFQSGRTKSSDWSFTITIDAITKSGLFWNTGSSEIWDTITNLAKQSASAGMAGSRPERFALEQNYPNPFNPETEIYFQLPEANHVVVAIFNTNGQEVRRLADAKFAAGYHSLRWNGMDNQGNPVSSGVYLYQLRTAAFSQVRKMSLMR
ncbi:MAG: T9SS type A sorting domain-containing protein [candidate division Zixibacteria bacterium]|nr:T9SS type A sorting domain-containing protein [candidate division Zixibacteria bacterium]